jgi:VanZ family protein
LDSDNTNRLKKIVERLSPEEGKYICRAVYRDPLTNIYWMLLIIYVCIMGVFLLWPFDFVLSFKNNARWIDNSNGIEFLERGQAISNSLSHAFYDRLIKGSGLTIALWLQTEDLRQFGPARILSYSIDPSLRNFTVGQSRDKLVFRLRTTKTSLNGTNPHLIVDDVFNYKGIQHMVIMYDFMKQQVYINGELKAQSEVLKGDFSNWDPSCILAIGNEVTGDRPWKGKIYYAAIFNRPLTEQEIRQSYLSGPWHKTNTGLPVLRRKENTKHIASKEGGPVVRYLFDEGKGTVIHDSGLISKPVNLFMPEYIRHKIKPFLGVSMDYLQSRSGFSDLIINILIFIPLGILIHGMLRSRFGITLKMSLAVLLAGTLFSLGIESIQHFSVTRNSSLIDVSTNTIGTVLGIVMYRCYNLFLNYQAKHLEMLIYDRKD